MSDDTSEVATENEMLTATTDSTILYAELCKLVDENQKLERERDEAMRLLRDLLAILHSDGGHHTANVGLAVSTLDASKKFESLINEREDMRAERNEWSKCAERLAAIVAANETEFYLANDIDLALEEFNQLKNKYE